MYRIPCYAITRSSTGHRTLTAERYVEANLKSLETSADAERLLVPLAKDWPEERFGAIFTNEEKAPLGVIELCRGDAVRVQFSLRKLVGVTEMHWEVPSVITWHNHLGASARPSKTDVETFRNLRSACRILGIDLVDNVIVAPGSKEKPFYFFFAAGRFEEQRQALPPPAPPANVVIRLKEQPAGDGAG